MNTIELSLRYLEKFKPENLNGEKLFEVVVRICPCSDAPVVGRSFRTVEEAKEYILNISGGYFINNIDVKLEGDDGSVTSQPFFDPYEDEDYKG